MIPAMSGTGTLLLRLYRNFTWAIAPIAFAVVARKLRAAGVSDARIDERKGIATLPRPDGTLIWFHAASVGESLSVLALIARIGERLGAVEFLITSGTATSAALVAKRLPPRTRHQFAPLDAPGPVTRFLDHWRPDAGIFVESEIWPGMLTQARARGVRLALLNARLSEKSVQGWRKRPRTARAVLGVFDILLTQNAENAENLIAMGAEPTRVETGINLKSTSAPLPVDADALAEMQSQLDSRPLWVASSTHPGEEEIVLAAHRRLLERWPDLCLLLVPRHPERGDEVASLIARAGFDSARRSNRETITDKTQVYLADTLGETGTWYALAGVVFLGGSLTPIGGHNPFEPAQAGAAVITGPGTHNFSETFVPLIAAGGAVEVSDAPSLASAVAAWLSDPDSLDAARHAAGGFAEARQSALDDVAARLCPALGLGLEDA